jgi:Tfp pilus assembly PilM family ATPase/Tfp pilus assembly protein PilN
MFKIPLSNFKIALANQETFTGLEIEGGYIKLARAVDTARGRKIVSLIVKKLSSHSEREILAALKDITEELKGPIGPLTICIPRHKITVRLLRFPTVSEKEIEEMVKLQSLKELPFSKEELVSDYLITERTREGYSRIVLAIVHEDVVNGYVDILKKAGLEPERITFSTEAITTWHRAACAYRKFQGRSILIDIDSEDTEIALFYNSHLGFSRGLAFGAVQLQESADLKNKLAEEIKWTIEGYSRQEKVGKIEKILLGQAGESIEGLKDFLSQAFNLPCEMVSPLESLSCREDIAPVQYKDRLSLLRILGMVLEGKGRKINLVPEALREKQRIKSGRRKSGMILALLLGIILLAFGIFARAFHIRELYLSYLNTEIGKTSPLAKEVENMLEKVRLVAARRQIRGSCVDILRELHNVTPQDISLSSFIYDEQNKMATFQGVSDNMSRIHAFIKSLEKSEYFKNVLSKYMREKKARPGRSGRSLRRDARATEFKIECSLEQ